MRSGTLPAVALPARRQTQAEGAANLPLQRPRVEEFHDQRPRIATRGENARANCPHGLRTGLDGETGGRTMRRGADAPASPDVLPDDAGRTSAFTSFVSSIGALPSVTMTFAFGLRASSRNASID